MFKIEIINNNSSYINTELFKHKIFDVLKII